LYKEAEKGYYKTWTATCDWSVGRYSTGINQFVYNLVRYRCALELRHGQIWLGGALILPIYFQR